MMVEQPFRVSSLCRLDADGSSRHSCTDRYTNPGDNSLSPTGRRDVASAQPTFGRDRFWIMQ